jgi:hypothetical protein
VPADDLLRHVIGPSPYSLWWLWLAVLLLLVLVLFYAGVFLLTMPNRRLRDVPVLGAARDRFLKNRFAKAIHEIGTRYRSGELDVASAGAGVSRELRSFLHQATGVRAEYMQTDDIAATSEIAVAAPLLTELIDAQFNNATQVDLGRVSDDAESLVRSWT